MTETTIAAAVCCNRCEREAGAVTLTWDGEEFSAECACGGLLREVEHDARPDDNPEPGDRCKDCGRDITWRGPGPYDWDHVAD